jgi:flagellar hook-basal body complex protein FliE
MVNGVGSGGGMGRAAIEAALKRQAEAMNQMQGRMADLSGGRTSESSGFKDSMNAVEGLKSLDSEVKKADELAQQLITGEVSDFHEVAAQLKQSDLSFKFALQVRNKLVDAYREVMRMGV